MPYLTEDQLRRALTLADLTDPAYGPHCMQHLVAGATGALRERWGCPVLVHRASRVVAVADNYDALGYPPDGPARESPLHALRRRAAPAAQPDLGGRARRRCASWRRRAPDDVLVCAPGLVYRRDAIDRLHVGEPHQLDLWRVTRAADGAARPRGDDRRGRRGAAARARAGARSRRATPTRSDGREVEVLAGGEWVELLECGLAHPRVLAAGGLGRRTRGWRMGIGLDRARRCCARASATSGCCARDDPRVARQMRDLERLPRGLGAAARAARHEHRRARAGLTDEDLGDRVRGALSAEQAEWVEEVAVAARDAGGRAAGRRPRAHRHRRGPGEPARARRPAPPDALAGQGRGQRAARPHLRRAARGQRTRVGGAHRGAGLERLLAPVGGDRVGVEVADLACSPRDA